MTKPATITAATATATNAAGLAHTITIEPDLDNPTHGAVLIDGTPAASVMISPAWGDVCTYWGGYRGQCLPETNYRSTEAAAQHYADRTAAIDDRIAAYQAAHARHAAIEAHRRTFAGNRGRAVRELAQAAMWREAASPNETGPAPHPVASYRTGHYIALENAQEARTA